MIVLRSPGVATDEARPTASVYVDGFNLYRRVLQSEPTLKWLDLARLCDLLLPTFDVVRVRYFTAMIRATLGTDPQAPVRQQTYVRALRTSPRITVHEGTFRIDRRIMPVHPARLDDGGRLVTVGVRKTEEKGSDVNLAAHMLVDAFRGEAETFFLLSNDSDFTEAFRMVRDEAGGEIGLISPTERPSASLLSVAPAHIRKIRRGALERSRFPEVLHDDRGVLHRPAAWGGKS
ncbi:NYN domain-containing protein [Rathayibacter festucae]|uniref:NYN domain-containing protein n=1 Tax=Rathayibacter festucae DSM 15932 TaxID=1328866 RepID=A0A3T0T3I4_9MICO|nr:NYN domain-containing protein [Rathayibacter festucae]AZZ53153.1 NYN domain-containing protein [Rathayibacter festucae DSM 15932]